MSRTFLVFARGCRRASTTTTRSNKTYWKPSSTEVNCGNWPNPPSYPAATRIPGLKLDHPRQLAVMHSLVRFANVAANGRFTTADLHGPALHVLGATAADYSLASFRYDLSKLRAKGLVERIPHSRRYQLVGKGYAICVAFLKLFERIYAPLTAGLLAPFRGDRALPDDRRCTLDRLYQRICDDLDALLKAVGLNVAA